MIKNFLKLSKEKKLEFLKMYSEKSYIDLDLLLSLYTVLEDNVFFVLILLENKNIKFLNIVNLINIEKIILKKEQNNEQRN